jgi:hypothetical protein
MAAHTPALRAQGGPRQDAMLLTAFEQSLTEKLQQRIEKQVAVTVTQKLALEADYPRVLARQIQDTLHDRLLLEKERLG